MKMIGRRRIADPLALGTLSRASAISDIVIGLAVTLLLVAAAADMSSTVLIAGIMVGIAMGLRRIAPSIMLLLALASAALQVITVDVAIGASLFYPVLFYTAGNHPNARVRGGSLAVAVVGSAIAARVYPAGTGDASGSESPAFMYAVLFVCIAVLLVGGWTFGYIRFQRQSVEQARIAERIAELERRRMLDLYDEQAQRSSLARDMHDVVAHSLAVVVAQAEGARFVLDADPAATKDALGVIADTARQALADVRGVLEELRSTESTAEHARTDRGQLYERMLAAGMDLQTTESGSEDSASPVNVRVAFAVLTEALTNALKYGDLNQPVRVDHDWTDGCRLTVHNRCSSAPLAPGGAGHGIRGMTERAELAGGSLTSAAVDDGWEVRLHLPAHLEGPS